MDDDLNEPTATHSELGPAVDEHSVADNSPSAGGKSLRERLISGAFWSAAGRACSVGSLILANILLGRTLSGDEYAAYVTSFASIILLAMLTNFGTPKILVRSIKQHMHHGQPVLAKAAVYSCGRTVLLTGCSAVAVFLFASQFFGDAPKWRGLRDYSILLAVWFCLSAMCLALAHVLQAYDDFRAAAMVGAQRGGAMPNLAFLLFVWIAGRMGILTLGLAIVAQVVLLICAFLLALYFVGKHLHQLGSCTTLKSAAELQPTTVSPEHNSKWFLHEGWPNLVIQLTSMGIVYVEVLVVGLTTSERGVADYAAVLALIGIVGAAQALATATLGPFVAELYAKGNWRKLEQVLRGSATIVAVPTLAIVVMYLVFPEFVLSHTYGKDFLGAIWPLRIVAVCAAITILSGSNGLTLVMAGKQRNLMVYSVIASLTYLLVAPFCIQTWGIVGAAIAVCVVFSCYNIFVTILVKQSVGVWTIPSFSPRVFTTTFQSIFRM